MISLSVSGYQIGMTLQKCPCTQIHYIKSDRTLHYQLCLTDTESVLAQGRKISKVPLSA